jgi:hypothetical protein
MNSTLSNRYAQLTDLCLVSRSSHHMIGKALEHGVKTTHLTQSYLILCLSFKEYCHATNLVIDQFSCDEFETILRLYQKIVMDYPDQNLLIFSIDEVKEIIAKVGNDIRSIALAEELSIGLTT